MNTLTWRRRAAERLRAAGSPDPEADAKLLSWGSALRELSPEEQERLERLLERRLAGEPVQYVLGSAWFMGFEFFVDARVLIPRQDTEVLVEAALAFIAPLARPRVLDLCAGSGAIGLSMAMLRPDAVVALSDISPDACDVMRVNCERLGARADILRGDLFAAVAGRTFDLIACNPPYVRSGELPRLQPEVRREPMLALDGGADGLQFYRRVAGAFRAHCSPRGALIAEIGFDQAADVRSIFGGGEILRDLRGCDRAILLRGETEHGTHI